MKTGKIFSVPAVCGIIICTGASALANVPAPPVNQTIGIPDQIFTTVPEAGCRGCHADPAPPEYKITSFIADRHHLRVGLAVQSPTELPLSTPGVTYECLSCHSLNVDPVTLAQELTIEADCLVCHIPSTTIPNVHHRTKASLDRDCKSCHGLVDNPNDGHYIPIEPVDEGTPKAMSNQPGSCRFCHNSGQEIDAATGLVIYNPANTHHSTGVHLVPNNDCYLCHNPQNILSIRTCEKCHGVNSLHRIQTDSDGDGRLIRGWELPGFGHVGYADDCMGCHALGVPTGSLPVNADATIPYVTEIPGPSAMRGKGATITMHGSGFMSLSTDPGVLVEHASNVILTHRTGNQLVLNPTQLTEGQLTVSVPPYASPGAYTVRLVKDEQFSNSKKITVLPAIEILDVTCSPGGDLSRVTVTGSGFGEYHVGMDATNAGIGVAMDSAPCTVASWSDTGITALCNPVCGQQVAVDTLFGVMPAPIGSALQVCTTCHEDNASLVNCRNKLWRAHLSRNYVSRAVYVLAETTNIGESCLVPNTTVKDRTRK